MWKKPQWIAWAVVSSVLMICACVFASVAVATGTKVEDLGAGFAGMVLLVLGSAYFIAMMTD